MIKTVTSITTWNDSVGKRASITYSEIDETTGKIISDNKRTDVVVTDKDVKATIDDLLDYAQTVVDMQE
jgi:hypothetical protein